MQLGLDADAPTCLLVGGGDGMGGITSIALAIAQALEQRDARSQLVVVCGRNEQARKELAAAGWPANVCVKVLGFVSEMEQWMGAADVLVSKAGPGTIAEAAAMGLPCVLSSYLPGQEEGNVDFVADAGFGALEEQPEQIGHTVRAWLNDPKRLAAMASAATGAARPAATAAIARDLATMVLGKEAAAAAAPAA
jgi:1,2-diacylglycerol 3-beta-galactosyltransferase